VNLAVTFTMNWHKVCQPFSRETFVSSVMEIHWEVLSEAYVADLRKLRGPVSFTHSLPLLGVNVLAVSLLLLGEFACHTLLLGSYSFLGSLMVFPLGWRECLRA